MGGGAYRKDLMLGYFDSLASVTRGASTNLVLPATQEHEAYGPWWSNLTCRYQNVKWTMVLSAGWGDLFHHTMLDAWFGLREQSDSTVKDDHVLIVRPLGHDIASDLDLSLLEKTRLMAAAVDSLIVGGELTSEFWKWNKCSDEWAWNNDCTCQG